MSILRRDAPGIALSSRQKLIAIWLRAWHLARQNSARQNLAPQDLEQYDPETVLLP